MASRRAEAPEVKDGVRDVVGRADDLRGIAEYEGWLTAVGLKGVARHLERVVVGEVDADRPPLKTTRGPETFQVGGQSEVTQGL
jgi:hypothetical protein